MHTHTHTSIHWRVKVIIRNQVHADHWLALTWFKSIDEKVTQFQELLAIIFQIHQYFCHRNFMCCVSVYCLYDFAIYVTACHGSAILIYCGSARLKLIGYW